jgi:hypothetical protein
MEFNGYASVSQSMYRDMLNLNVFLQTHLTLVYEVW